MTKAPAVGREKPLRTAVQELTSEVKALRELLERDYPSRDEVKREGRQRALRYLAASVVLLLVSQFLTIILISHCFLGDTTRVREPCGIIPGYSQKVDESNKTLADLYGTLNQIEENRKAVKELELEIEKIKAQRGTQS